MLLRMERLCQLRCLVCLCLERIRMGFFFLRREVANAPPLLADQHLLGLLKPGEHGSTFGGNPLGAAVARAALQVITDEHLIENAAIQGEYFMEQIAELPSHYVKEVRGKGLLIGVELKPEAGGARRFCEALQDNSILAKETHENVIRFAPPLIIDRQTIDWALARIRTALNIPPV